MIEINGLKYFTNKEVAEKFNVHTSTIARWRQIGLLPFNEINQRKYLYSEKDLEQFIIGEKQ